MTKWRTEIEELHEVFESYFLGTTDSLDRVDAVLGPDFTIVGPGGAVSNRSQTMEALRAGHAHTSSLTISITEPKLLIDADEYVVASYVENHELSERSNHRISTVVFSRRDEAPNGLIWQRVHETWID